jgi:hypothetical protein
MGLSSAICPLLGGFPPGDPGCGSERPESIAGSNGNSDPLLWSALDSLRYFRHRLPLPSVQNQPPAGDQASWLLGTLSPDLL